MDFGRCANLQRWVLPFGCRWVGEQSRVVFQKIVSRGAVDSDPVEPVYAIRENVRFARRSECNLRTQCEDALIDEEIKLDASEEPMGELPVFLLVAPFVDVDASFGLIDAREKIGLIFEFW